MRLAATRRELRRTSDNIHRDSNYDLVLSDCAPLAHLAGAQPRADR